MLKLIEDLQGNDNPKIKQAEQTLSSYQLSNVTGFCTQCCKIMSDINVSVSSRQYTGTLLRRTILQNINNVVGWEHLPKNTRQQIKLEIARLLESKDRPVKRSAADNVSAICAIELPKNQWPNIVNNLVQNVGHQSIDIKQASLMALGFICQLMKERGTFVSKDDIEGIFAGIVNGMKDPIPSINQLAMNAFISCLPSCQHVFNNEKVRSVVLGELVNIVNGSEEKSKILALQTISEMCKVVYFAMQLCVETLVKLTIPLMTNYQNPDISRGAMEIWSSLLQEYIDLKMEKVTENYIKTDVAKILAGALMNNMTIAEDDDEELSIRGSAYRALCHLGEANPNDIYQLVINFVSASIADQDWKKRQASIKAFTSLLDGIEHQAMVKLTNNALIQFLRLLEDNSIIVQQSAAFALSKIAEKVPQSFVDHSELQRILKLLMSCLNKKPQISKDICQVFSELFGSPAIKNSKIIQQQLDNLFAALFKNGMRNDVSDGSIAGSSFLAAMVLMVQTRNPSIAIKYCQIILQNFFKTFQAEDASLRQAIQSGMFSVLQNAITSLYKSPFLTPQILDSIYQLVVAYFQKIGDVDSNGIYVLAELSGVLPPETPYIQTVWKYVMHALTKSQDSDLFKATMILIGDLSRFNPEKFSPYMVIINDLLVLFADPNFNNQCKFSILITIGDLFLSCTLEAQKYLQKVMQILGKALEGCMYLISTHFDYVDKLRQALIESLTALLHSLNSRQKQNPLFIKYLPVIVQFAKFNNTPAAKPSINFMRQSMLLCLDLIHLFGKSALDLFRDSYLQETLKILQTHNKGGQQQDVLEFAKMVIKI